MSSRSAFWPSATKAGIERPEVNVALEVAGRWIKVDCLWREQRLIVELDGHASHSTRRSFERDRGRDRALQAEHWRVVRVTWRELHLHPRQLAVDLQTMLTAAIQVFARRGR